MTTYYAADPGLNCLRIKVTYEDVAGAYGGWFLTVLQGDDLTNLPSAGPNVPEENDIHLTSDPHHHFVRDQVNAKLNAMLGAGHSATWSATIVESVTPAVIDDNW